MMAALKSPQQACGQVCGDKSTAGLRIGEPRRVYKVPLQQRVFFFMCAACACQLATFEATCPGWGGGGCNLMQPLRHRAARYAQDEKGTVHMPGPPYRSSRH